MSKKEDPIDDMRFADFLSDIVAKFDPQLRHTYVNSAVEHFTGLKSEDFLGRTNRELGMPADLVNRWDDVLGQVFRTGEQQEIQFRFEGPTGELHFHTRLIPQKTRTGGVTSVISIARDITGTSITKPPEVDVRLETDRYQAILESTDDAIVGKTLDGIVTSWNAAAELMFGYSAAEMLGQSVIRIFPRDRIDEEAFILERLRNGEKVDHFETVRLHKSGRLVHVSVTTSPIRNAHGEIVGASKIARDITPLKVERERLKLALDATGNGLWDWNLITGTVFRSDHYLALTGYTQNEDTRDFEFFKRTVHPHDLQRVMQGFDDCRGGRSDRIELEYRLVTKGGFRGAWVMVRGQAVERDGNNVPTRIVGTLTDITQSKKTYACLLDREERLSRVIDGSDQGYWDWNIQTNSLDVSPRWASMLGYRPDEIDVSNGKFSKYVHPEDFESVMGEVQKHLAGELPKLEAEIRCLTKAGEWIWVLTRGRLVERDHMGNPLMVSGMLIPQSK